MALLRELIQEMKTKLDTIAENAKPFDVHDDVTTQNTSPSGGDRIPHSDESAAGDPNEYFRLDVLRDYFRRNAADTYSLIESLLDYNDLLNQPTIPTLRNAAQTYALIESLLDYDDLSNQPTIPTLRSASQTYALIQSLLNYNDLSNQPTIPTPFDIHDDVPTQNTAPANQDRIPHSDESAAGDPNEYFRLDTLRDYFRRDAQQTFDLIESLLPEGIELRTAQETFDLIEDLLPEGGELRTAAETYALIQSLLNYNDLSNQPTIPTPFNVHDDVPTQNTSPSGADRIPHSDESAAGDPNEYFRLDVLRDYVRRNAADTYSLIDSLLDYNDLLNQPTIPTAFDVHDDVTTQNTNPNDADRIPHSDESAGGDPNKYFRLDTLKDFFGGGGGLERETTLPDADDAVSGAIYAEVDSDDAILNDVLKVKSFRQSPFFAVTVANLGDGHRGYAGSGYGSLDSGYDVNSGGSAGYSALGAVSEHFSSAASATFQRVGTYTITVDIEGLAGSGAVLYYVYDTGSGSYVRGINPETEAEVFLSEFESQADDPRGLAIVGNNAFFNDDGDNDIYVCDLTTGVITRLAQGSGFSNVGLASDGTTLYIIYQSGLNFFVSEVNQTTGEAHSSESLSGYNSNDAELPRSFTYIDGSFYVGTIESGSSDPYLYTLDVSNGALTEVGPISPENANFEHFGGVGSNIYAWNEDDDGIYRTTVGLGNRWEVLFPDGTTEVGTGDTTLKLFAERGGDEIELTRDTAITDAVVFASELGGATAHTISVGDNLDVALYKDDDTPLHQGADEAFYRDIPLEAPAIGV